VRRSPPTELPERDIPRGGLGAGRGRKQQALVSRAARVGWSNGITSGQAARASVRWRMPSICPYRVHPAVTTAAPCWSGPSLALLFWRLVCWRRSAPFAPAPGADQPSRAGALRRAPRTVQRRAGRLAQSDPVLARAPTRLPPPRCLVRVRWLPPGARPRHTSCD